MWVSPWDLPFYYSVVISNDIEESSLTSEARVAANNVITTCMCVYRKPIQKCMIQSCFRKIILTACTSM